MSEVTRFILPGGRELRTTLARGEFIVAIHDAGTNRVTQLALRPGELAVFRRALTALTVGQKRRRAETA
jgi:hypothetical protein